MLFHEDKEGLFITIQSKLLGVSTSQAPLAAEARLLGANLPAYKADWDVQVVSHLELGLLGSALQESAVKRVMALSLLLEWMPTLNQFCGRDC